jgi:hypothetical protein
MSKLKTMILGVGLVVLAGTGSNAKAESPPVTLTSVLCVGTGRTHFAFKGYRGQVDELKVVVQENGRTKTFRDGEGYVYLDGKADIEFANGHFRVRTYRTASGGLRGYFEVPQLGIRRSARCSLGN